MDNTGGLDSGFDFGDSSNNAGDADESFQAGGVDVTDEGISVPGNLSDLIQVGSCYVGFEDANAEYPYGGEERSSSEGDQEAVAFSNENSENNSNSVSYVNQGPSEDNSLDAGADREDQVNEGDDNNNDRPDDVNNNTTDPQMQQIQMQRRQEQNLQLRPAIVHVQNGVTERISNETPNKKDKRKKKKKKKKNRLVTVVGADGKFSKEKSSADKDDADEDNEVENESEVDVEYVPEQLELSVFDPLYRTFARVFENFRISETKIKEEPEDGKLKETDAPAPAASLTKVPKIDLDDENEDVSKDDKPKMSKRKLKKLTRLSIAELKQVVPRPDVVEMHDVTARDPKLLVHLKSYRNTVPVPRHWCYKRKYLQGKRGIEKAPFDLPGFIKKTGIMEMRAALAEKEETKTLKAKIRERVRPKMGKIDIDYQKLHDAFFKWQSKPKMTIHGDLYYEGKEFETRMKDKKPGELSDDLRTALGMPVGPNSQRVPPPWLIAMQRYGPPPSYPHLKIPGLNAPIPESCSFGYHAGGWGKPPVDEFGRPLYGDVFGLSSADALGGLEDDNVDKTLWGELESEEEVESEEEEEEEDEEEKEEEGEGVEESGLQTPAEGLQTPSGFSSIPAGLETPELIELRKKRIEQDMEGNDTPSLYTVLPEKRVDRIGGAMMASTHVYDLTGVKEKSRVLGIAPDQGRVELNLDPSELDLVENEGTLAARYEQQLKEQQSHTQQEDLSDMVAEHAAKQKSKRKRQLQQQDVKQAKKRKEFKF